MVASAVFVAIGVWMVLHPDESSRRSVESQLFWGWANIVFFGLCGLSGLFTLRKPAEIRLTPEGFQVLDRRTGEIVPWDEVEAFSVTSVRGAKWVSYKKTGGRRSILRTMSDGALPSQLDQSPEAVRDLMEEWRARYATLQQDQAAAVVDMPATDR